MDVVVKPSKVMSQILSFFYTHFKNPNIVYLSCLHLWTTRPPRLFLKMLPIIWVFLLSCLSNLWCILIFGQHTHTHNHTQIYKLAHIYLTKCYNFAASKSFVAYWSYIPRDIMFLQETSSSCIFKLLRATFF